MKNLWQALKDSLGIPPKETDKELDIVLYVIESFHILADSALSTKDGDDDVIANAMIYTNRETASFLQRGVNEGKSGFDIMESALAFVDAESERFALMPHSKYNSAVVYGFTHDAKVYLESYFTEKNFPRAV